MSGPLFCLSVPSTDPRAWHRGCPSDVDSGTQGSHGQLAGGRGGGSVRETIKAESKHRGLSKLRRGCGPSKRPVLGTRASSCSV